MRHGEKDGDALTELGRRQVDASAVKHVFDNFSRVMGTAEVYASEMNRARESAMIVLDLAPQLTVQLEPDKTWPPKAPEVTVKSGFGYAWIDEAKDGNETLGDVAARLQKDFGDKLTPQIWLNQFEGAVKWRDCFVHEMLEAAKNAEEYNSVVICSHDPIIALAANEYVRNLVIGHADIVRYTIEDGRIVESTLLRCPPVE